MIKEILEWSKNSGECDILKEKFVFFEEIEGGDTEIQGIESFEELF